MELSTLLTSFSLGLLASLSPCVLPLYPGFLAYLTGSKDTLANSNGRYFLGAIVLAGVLSMMLLLGALIAGLSVSISRALAVIIPIANLLILSLGVLLLMNINPFKKLPQIQVPLLSNPYVNAYLYGLLYGPIALPCSGPLVVGIFAFSFTAEEFVGKLAVFLAFGLGFGMPLFILSFLSGSSQRWITRTFAEHGRLINAIAGVILIGVALYDTWKNWAMLSSFLPF